MSISVEPQGTITLVKCPLEADYRNTFTFANVTAQTNYFTGLTGKKILGNDYTYIRKDGMISVAEPIDTIINYNYLYYNNTGFSNKTYYCFIDRMEYMNENCTHIYFHTDVFQTWYFDLTWNRCYVEREHTNDDTIGKNLVPEGLETGEYKHYGVSTLYDIDDTYIVIATTYLPFGNTSYGDKVYNGVYSGQYYIAFSNSAQVSLFLQFMDTVAKADAVIALFLVPRDIHDTLTSHTWTLPSGTSYTFTCAIIETNGIYDVYDTQTLSRPSTLDGYTPKNNKLLVWPYNYFYVTNNNGSAVDFRYEDFSNPSTVTFKTIGAITPGSSTICIPMDYKGMSDIQPSGDVNSFYNYDSGIPLGKLPICSWSSDVYINWLTQSSVNRTLTQYSAATKLAAGTTTGLLTGNVGKALNSTITAMDTTFNLIAEKYEHSLVPPQSHGNVNSGDVCYAARQTIIRAHKMTIKYNQAEIIDNFFSLYGYKTCLVKIPNITGRTYWNYIKTIGCNVEGDIPQEDLETIRSCCDAGITFWHDTTKMYHYELTNSIVT